MANNIPLGRQPQGKLKVGVQFVADPRNVREVSQSLGQAMGRANQFEGEKQFQKAIRPLGRITGQADEFSKSMAASNARVIAFGASVAIINGVTQSFKNLIQTTIEVEKVFADINVVLGASADELERFSRGLFEVSRQTAQSFSDVAEGALEFARQGLSMEESLKRIKDALILVRLTGLDAVEAVEGLTAAVNTFKQEGITTGEVINKLAELDVAFAVSTEDLIKGIERSGASAGQAKVSFEELAAIIAVLQERTARGGAVIGNALKTIFARVQTTDTLQALENVGVAVRDSQGDILPLIQILEDLSIKIKDLSDIKEAKIIEKVAGKRQRDILINLLNDLGDATGRWGEALQTVSSDAATAYEKNEKLNQTLYASIQRISTSVQELGKELGNLGFLESLTDFSNWLEGAFGFINKLIDKKSGIPFLRATIAGIGETLVTVGIPLIAAIILKLTTDLAKFGVVSLKTILGLNKQAKERARLEESILHIMMQHDDVLDILSDKEKTRYERQLGFLDILQRQKSVMDKMALEVRALVPFLQARNVKLTEYGLTPTRAEGYIPNKASGFIPNHAMREEKESIQRGVGGARGGDQPVMIKEFNYGRGKKGPIVAHTGEYIVENYKGSGGSAIFNRDMAENMGLPKGAKKITPQGLSGGFIPNFVKPPISLLDLWENGSKQGVQQLRRLKAGQFVKIGSQKFSAIDWNTTPQSLKENPLFVPPTGIAAQEKAESKRKGLVQGRIV